MSVENATEILSFVDLITSDKVVIGISSGLFVMAAKPAFDFLSSKVISSYKIYRLKKFIARIKNIEYILVNEHKIKTKAGFINAAVAANLVNLYNLYEKTESIYILSNDILELNTHSLSKKNLISVSIFNRKISEINEDIENLRCRFKNREEIDFEYEINKIIISFNYARDWLISPKEKEYNYDFGDKRKAGINELSS